MLHVLLALIPAIIAYVYFFDLHRFTNNFECILRTFV